ncbi:MAG: HD-GYP domain-containing protein [bacterium]
MNKEKLLNDISKIGLQEEDEKIALFKIIEASVSFLNGDSGFIYLSKDKEGFIKTVSYGTLEIPNKIEIGKGGIGCAISEEKPLILSRNELPEIKDISQAMIAPLYDKMGLVGIFGLASSNAVFSKDDLSVFSQIQAQINLCLEIFRLSKSIYEGVLLSTIQTLVSVVEAIDPNLRGHSWNMARYAVALASKMNLPKIQIEAIKYAALLHGIGRIGIPDRIWRKEGSLTDDELKAMRAHAIIGEKIVEKAKFPFNVASIVRSHHENYDGTGYPDGLKKDEIPIGARIIALANAWEAMTGERPYRQSKTIEEAIAEIKSKKGTQFDPEITDIFLSMMER